MYHTANFLKYCAVKLKEIAWFFCNSRRLICCDENSNTSEILRVGITSFLLYNEKINMREMTYLHVKSHNTRIHAPLSLRQPITFPVQNMC